MSDEKIAAGRAHDRRAKGRYYDEPKAAPETAKADAPIGIVQHIIRWFRGK